jgi:RHS repeat-associated protein
MSATTASQTVFSIGYDFHLGNGDNGNVFGITNYKDSNRNQTFTYDGLNRLISAQNAGSDCTKKTLNPNQTEYWGNNYTYDAWGNLLGKTVTKCSGENLGVTADTHNWIHASGTDYQYDIAGNMTFNATPPTQTYTYDQENRITGAAGYTYTYDGDGDRVRKSNGNLAGNGTLYWYMSPGVMAETDLAGTIKSEYVFFDGERVARRDGVNGAGGVFYYFSDHLKTASVITDAGGTPKAESDYYPWGGELQFIANDTNDYKFTGRKRDLETGLDYFGARYYSNGLGRWVSADWSATPVPLPYADLWDPQTLNLNAYVINNPKSNLDPNGHEKEYQLSGKYTALLHKNNQNDMPNVHVKKSGNEVARGKVNPETRKIEWDNPSALGQGIKDEVQALAEAQGMYELAAERAAVFNAAREAKAAAKGGKGGGGTLASIFNILMLADMMLQEYNREHFNSMESVTGVHMDIMGNIVVTDLQRASQFCQAGAQINHNGHIFTLDNDGHWKDKKGNELHQDDDGHFYSDDERT